MKSIIILLPVPFMKRDYIRYGIEKLKKTFHVKILDFTAWINPEVWNLHSNQIYKCEDYISINSEKDFSIFLSKVNSIIVIDHLTKDRKGYWIRQQLKKKNAVFIGMAEGNIPIPKTNILQQLKGLFFLFRKSKNFFYSFFKILEERYYSKKILAPDISIVGGLFALKNSKAEKKIYAHSWDYDHYLTNKDKQKNNKIPYAVFLDEDLVFGSDYAVRRIEPPVEKNEYYPLLLKFFKKFEIETGLPVNFAVHPKTSNQNIASLSNLLPGIKYFTGNTAELVKNSKIVLLHSSTAISFAVLYKKPTVFLTSNALKKGPLNHWIVEFLKEVNGQMINMSDELNKPIDIESLSKVDTDKYKYYLDKYIKMPNSPDMPLWEIFANYILNEKI